LLRHIALELRHVSFTGKIVCGRVVPMHKKSMGGEVKKYAVLAEPKKRCA
jgi:hypothetical protein